MSWLLNEHNYMNRSKDKIRKIKSEHIPINRTRKHWKIKIYNIIIKQLFRKYVENQNASPRKSQKPVKFFFSQMSPKCALKIFIVWFI